ncbi:MAG: PEP-CTERM system TPR-repeat protein PrsT [Rhodocyclaceae bacterium]|nr:PEP-CTERM system TPR-repeat protein PrsT [Rhodocyclaceae bacterium]
MNFSRRTGMSLLVAGLISASAVLHGCSSDNPEKLIASAQEFLAKRDYKSASIQLRNVLQKHPDSGVARFLLGRTLIRSGDPVTAEKELRRALELKYAADDVQPLLALAILSQGQAKRVVDEFSATTLGNPERAAELKATVGNAYLLLGKGQEAQEAFDAALKIHADSPTADLGLARLRLIAKDVDGASEIVDRVIAKHPDLGEAYLTKTAIYSARSDEEGLNATYRKLLELEPDNLRAHYALVTSAIGKGKLDEAQGMLDRMRKIAPNHPFVQFLSGLLDYQKKNFASANDFLQKALAAMPNHLPSLTLAGAVNIELKSYGLASQNLEKAIGIAPDSPYVRQLLVRAYLMDSRPSRALEAAGPLLKTTNPTPAMLSLIGETYLASGDVAKASEFFERASKQDPKNAAALAKFGMSRIAGGDAEEGMRILEKASDAAGDTLPQADIALAVTHLQRKEYAKAMDAIAEVERKRPKSPLPGNLRGIVLLAQNDIKGARAAFEQSVSIDPRYFPSISNLARLDLMEKNPQAAIARIEALIAQDPKNSQAMLALAQLKANNGSKPEEVRPILEKAIAANPAEREPRVALVRLLGSTGEASKALEAATELERLFPSDPQMLEVVGTAQFLAGETNRAIQTFNQVVALRPESPVALFRLGEAQAATRNLDAAAESFKKALQLKPDYPEAQNELVKVYVVAQRIPEALAVAKQMQKQSPKAALGYGTEGDVLGAARKWSEAATAYREALKRERLPGYTIRLHVVLLRQNLNAEADKLASDWLRDNPKDVLLRNYLAERALAEKEYPKAIELYRAALQYGNNALMLNNMAWAMGQTKDPKALETAEKAYKLAPEQPTVIDTYAMLLLASGDSKRALELQRAAVAKAPQSMELRLNLAKTLIAAGDKAGAKRELEALSASEKFKRHDEVVALLKTL